ncbi:MAG: hypothetical protein ACYDH4_10635 [Candidatus Cryosericum sp.]
MSYQSSAVPSTFQAQLFQYEQASSASSTVTIPTGTVVILVQDYQNNGHIQLQGTGRMVWVH